MTRSARFSRLPAVIAFGAGLLFSMASFFLVERYYYGARVEMEFERRALTLAHVLQEELRENLEILSAIAGLKKTFTRLTRQEFHTFVQPVFSRHPQVQGLEWIPRVSAADRAVYEAAARADGFAGFQFTERNASGGPVPASQRPDYYPVYFVEPLAGNEAAFGFDLGSEPVRLAALQKARDSGQISFTSRIVLVQEHGRQYSVLGYEPVYVPGSVNRNPEERRINLTGFMVMVLHLSDAVEKSLRRLDQSGVDIMLIDETAPADNQVLYTNLQPGAAAPPTWDRSFDIGDRRWRMTFHLNRATGGWANPVPLGAWVVGLTIFTLTIALSGYLYTSAKYTRQIEQKNRAQQVSEDALRKSEKQYRELIEALQEGIWVIDAGAYTTFVNPRMAEMLGYTVEEMQGKHLFTFMDEQGAALCQRNLERRRQGIRENHPFELLRKDGTRLYTLMETAPITDASGTYIGAIAGVMNITAPHRAELALKESEFRFRQLAEHIHEVFYLVDIAGPPKTLYVSPAYERIWGRSIEDVYGRSEDFIEAIHPDDRMRMMTHRNEPRLGESTMEYRIVRPDGEIRWILDRSFPIRNENGQVYRAAGVAEDITGAKRAEEKLQQLNAGLEQRVAERTAELSAANVELARATRLKDEFLANMSHELRTPLNAILGLSEALGDQVFGAMNEKQLKSLHSIEESGRHLLDLINDILDLSKIEADKIELHIGPTDVAEVCQSSLRLIDESARRKELKVTSAIDHDVRYLLVDARRLKQIVVNLLSNAVKFTPPGGAIGLEVAGDAGRSAVRFTVWDTGIGIAESDMPRLFKPFVQLDSSLTRHQAGTGLGLSLVARLTERHGGTVSVESEVGKGSRFSVFLPRTGAGTPQNGNDNRAGKA